MNHYKPLPTLLQLKELFDYDKETGVITNKLTGFVYHNNIKHNYLKVNVQGKYKHIAYYAHRIIWKWMTGLEPLGVIDHINENTKDNRWENLQDISNADNIIKGKQHLKRMREVEHMY